MSSVRINSNVLSLNAQRRLGDASEALSVAYQRLSSGLRINRASDDAAGLAIAESLNTDRRVFGQGIRNLNDGVSLLNIADGTLDGLTQIVMRLQELAEQSANGVLGAKQRQALNEEGQALSDEYFRIARTAEFNGLKLFDGSIGNLRLQGGYGLDGGIAGGVGGALGTGSFGAAASYATEGYNSEAVALADLNGDGMLDLITAGLAEIDGDWGGFATVRLGRGDGTFGAATSFTTEGKASSAMSLGDLNGDGVLDLVTAGDGIGLGGFATVRLGRGDGTFGPATSYVTERMPSQGATLADLNGDGILDLGTAGTDNSNGYITIRLGLGGGSFGAATSYTVSTRAANCLAFGDLNGDGKPDLVSGDRGFATVRLGVGDGRFGAATSYAAESNSSLAVNLADLNGDGLLDLLTAGAATGVAGYATVRLGRGDGTFGQATSYLTEPFASQAAVLGDLNGDGVLDLLTSGQSSTNVGYVTMRLGRGDGTFGTATSYLAEENGSYAAAFGDLNGDGVLDVVTAGAAGSDGSATVRLSLTQDGVSPLLPFDLSTMSGARQALPVFQRKLNGLAVQRGQLGAFQARLAVAINTLRTTSENSAAAASRITNADIAHETAQLLRMQILQQSSASILSQANQQPALALRLLA